VEVSSLMCASKVCSKYLHRLQSHDLHELWHGLVLVVWAPYGRKSL
jgi:hypothetical protein